MTNLDELPNDILRVIFSYYAYNFKLLKSLRRTCKRFRWVLRSAPLEFSKLSLRELRLVPKLFPNCTRLCCEPDERSLELVLARLTRLSCLELKTTPDVIPFLPPVTFTSLFALNLVINYNTNGSTSNNTTIDLNSFVNLTRLELELGEAFSVAIPTTVRALTVVGLPPQGLCLSYLTNLQSVVFFFSRSFNQKHPEATDSLLNQLSLLTSLRLLSTSTLYANVPVSAPPILRLASHLPRLDTLQVMCRDHHNDSSTDWIALLAPFKARQEKRSAPIRIHLAGLEMQCLKSLRERYPDLVLTNEILDVPPITSVTSTRVRF